ncbi:MAG: hypothetical protein UT34_C0001G0180 [candidate division WS6 bacterium GW2011_GWF2_39_15]|uniref:Uncharacterized protein n=1 Tax=candidate division WS6 bacterium GW2011_GWF2_39_15 TaxID=1619100 RepID=A0A0G0Q6W0_9BACT|nr:MAG: hypothetical protein UT34_C0001G0180 [candidate division WS6 bacterium GW2011_GWF2_39_15]
MHMALPLRPQNPPSDRKSSETYLSPYRERYITESEDNSVELDRLRITWQAILEGSWNMSREMEVLSINRGQNEQEYTRERVAPNTPVSSLNADNKGIFQITLRSVQDPRIGPNGRRMDGGAPTGEGMLSTGIEVDCAIYEPDADRNHFYRDFNIFPPSQIPMDSEGTIATSGVIELNGVYQTRTRNIIILERIPIGGRIKLVATQIRIYLPITDGQISELEQNGYHEAGLVRESSAQAVDLLNDLTRLYEERVHARRIGNVIPEAHQTQEIQSHDNSTAVNEPSSSPTTIPTLTTPHIVEPPSLTSISGTTVSQPRTGLSDWAQDQERQFFENDRPRIQQEVEARVLAELEAARQRNASQRAERITTREERITHGLRDAIRGKLNAAVTSQAFDDLQWKDDLDGRRRYETSAVWGTKIQATISLLDELSGRKTQSTQDASQPRQRGRSMEDLISAMGPRPNEHPMYKVITRAIEQRDGFISNRNQAFVLRGMEYDGMYSNEWYLVERILDPNDNEWKTAVSIIAVIPSKPLTETEYLATARSIFDNYLIDNGRDIATERVDIRNMARHSVRYIN